jgi:hypothetical protein
MFILVCGSGISLKSLNASSNQTLAQNMTNTSLFMSGNQTLPTLGNETIRSTLSKLIPEPGNLTEQYAAPEHTKNITQFNNTSMEGMENASLSSTMEKIRTELDKLPKNASESEIINLQKKLLAASPFGPTILNQPYRVTVAFDSISIHADHDYRNPIFDWLGTNCCSGEWSLDAFVQGKPIELIDGNVDGGDLVNLPGKTVTVDVPKDKPLSILTIGYEDDTGFWDDCPLGPFGGCGFHAPGSLDPLGAQVVEILNGPVSTWIDALKEFQVYYNRNHCSDCVSDRLGYINKLYDPPTYGEGAHTNVVSDIGDFTLRYTITVVPPGTGGFEPGVDCDDDLGVNRVSASSTQNPMFGPEKTIDNNPGTYWMSTSSVNPSITLDLGAQRILCQVKIGWQDVNTYHFNVAVSKDGTSFTNLFSGTSSGSVNPELYNLGEVDARYLKVTVTQSITGSQNSQAKISEIDILGRFTGNEPGGPGTGPVER